MRKILIRHSDGTVQAGADLASMTVALRDPGSLVWVEMEGEPPNALQELSSQFDLHPVTVEDFINKKQRPKVEEFDHYTFLVVHALRSTGGNKVETDEVHIIIKSNALLTVHDRPLYAVKLVSDRFMTDSGFLRNGPSFLLYLLSDALVDAYFPVLDALGDEIDALEDAVVTYPARARMHRIFELKRVLVQLRKIVSPQREVFNALSRRDSLLIESKAAVYFRDVHDHLVRAYEIVDSYRDLVANTLDAYLAATSNRLGMVMKQLTVIATIFMPLSFLTGFFGMNFTSIPYDRPWLFAMLLMVMLGLPIAMVIVFARRGWIATHRRSTRRSRLRSWLGLRR